MRGDGYSPRHAARSRAHAFRSASARRSSARDRLLRSVGVVLRQGELAGVYLRHRWLRAAPRPGRARGPYPPPPVRLGL